jgi:hypothetical protein
LGLPLLFGQVSQRSVREFIIHAQQVPFLSSVNDECYAPLTVTFKIL